MAKVYIAIVPTYYVTYAVGDTRAKARSLALKSALAWLQMREAEVDGRPYKTMKQVEDYLGCNIEELPSINSAVQEG